jgi:hypothetical protein
MATNIQTFPGDVEIDGGLTVTGTLSATQGSDKVALTATTSDETDYIPLSKGTTGAQGLYTDSNLTYNPSNNTIGADISGNADSASTVAFTDRDTNNATDYIAFTDNHTAGNKALFTDSNLTYNPSNNEIGANINGNAANANNAYYFTITQRNSTNQTDHIVFVNDYQSGDGYRAMADGNLTYNSGYGEVYSNYMAAETATWTANRHIFERDGYWAKWRVNTNNPNGGTRLYVRRWSNSDGVEMYVNYLGSANDASDDRIKFNETPVENALETLMKLKPQTYDKRIFEYDDLSVEEYSNAAISNVSTEGYVYSPTHDIWRKRRHSDDSFKETGLIIQDVWYDAPELRHVIKLDPDANPSEEKPVGPVEGDIQQDPDYDTAGWGLHTSDIIYKQLVPWTIKGIQELNIELQTEKAKITDLITRVTALENV